jgi:hypothetical protein
MEEDIRDFIDYVLYESGQDQEGIRLKVIERSNSSYNDYLRDPTNEEVDKLIASYLLIRNEH